MSDDISLGELGRRLTDALGLLRSDVGDLRHALEQRPDWKDVDSRFKAAAEVQALRDLGQDERVATLTQRLDKVAGWGTWGNRLLLAAVGAAALGGILRPP